MVIEFSEGGRKLHVGGSDSMAEMVLSLSRMVSNKGQKCPSSGT
jgi:hypothetical protein